MWDVVVWLVLLTCVGVAGVVVAAAVVVGVAVAVVGVVVVVVVVVADVVFFVVVVAVVVAVAATVKRETQNHKIPIMTMQPRRQCSQDNLNQIKTTTRGS